MPNLVEITVHSTTDQAQRAIDELTRKLEDLGTKVAEARVKLSGDARAQEQITRINARLMELSRQVYDPKISLEGIAKAQAEILTLMAMLDKLNNQKVNPRFNFGGGGGFFGTITGALSSILNMGPAAIPILLAIAAAIDAAVVYVGSLITQLSAASIGVAAFGAFAIPTFMKIVAGIQAVSGAADKTARAAAWKAIPAALQPAVQAGLQLKGVFDKLVTAMQPTAIRVFGDALKIVGDILPQLLPMAISVGKAIDGLLRGFDSFAKSAGFKAFISQMDALAGPAVRAIGRGLGQVATSLGDLIQAGANPEGLKLLAGTFTVLAFAIRGIANAVRLAEAGLTNLTLFGARVARGLIDVAQNITDTFLQMAGTIANIAAKIPGPWQNAAKSLSRSIQSAQRTADTFFANSTARLNNFTLAVNSANPVYKLHGDITDLQNKVAASKALIKSVPPSKRVAIEANISQAEQQIAAIRAALNALNGYTATTYVQTITSPIYGPHETGGIIGAASGGVRSKLTMVGEHGRELVSLPTGSMVHSNPDTERMMGQMSGGGGRLIIGMDPQMPMGLGRELIKWLKFTVRTQGGGDVQVAFGSD